MKETLSNKSEQDVKRIVLTGGPGGGKSTVLEAVQKERGDLLIVAPEAATILLYDSHAFPKLGRDLDWSERWQEEFQGAITSLQPCLESSWELAAVEQNKRLLLCDRGLLDGAAYTPGGMKEFCRRYKVDRQAALDRYDAVIHLESLATAQPELYKEIRNDPYLEPLERAQELEYTIREVWSDHPNWRFISGQGSIQHKINAIKEILESLLSK